MAGRTTTLSQSSVPSTAHAQAAARQEAIATEAQLQMIADENNISCASYTPLTNFHAVRRDVAWFANVPHKELTVEKAVQNWIRVDGDKLRFPGGGTMFPHGADAYIDDIGKLIPLHDGSIRTALDTGCGVASWGAYLLSRDILAMSFAPRDSHEAQVQFALERGVPAMIGVLASNRLTYPARAFDMAHCSRCLIPWHLYDGLYLIELDRVLRPGGYWILSGPPINWKKYWKGWERSKEDLNAEQEAIEAVARSLCWKKIKEAGDIAVWQKPANHAGCKASRKAAKSPPFCSKKNADAAWYDKMEACVTPLPEVSDASEVAGGAVKKWPHRLTAVPPRVSRGTVKGVTAKAFQQDTELWKKRVRHYKAVINQFEQKGRYRNVLDMNARLGGFAAALASYPLWVMNMVPAVANSSALGVVYERGLIGSYQDWCEGTSTYPRTYDLIHADSVFTLYKSRVLRPEGTVIIRDDVDMLVKVNGFADRMRWDSQIVDHEDGPLVREKILLVAKTSFDNMLIPCDPEEEMAVWFALRRFRKERTREAAATLAAVDVGEAELHSLVPRMVHEFGRRNCVMLHVAGSSQDGSIIDLTSTGTIQVPGSDDEE
ncbi:putative methyltransferase PMT17 [Triticum urartu]|uniref:Methyltransferase n=1 Tax=Triticum urartu TaxID=4572 RepID=M8AFI0_TRIUA|nr:putative methyltransferase PMT17 [Triticum urartu]